MAGGLRKDTAVVVVAGLAMVWAVTVLVRPVIVGNPPTESIAAPNTHHERALVAEAFERLPHMDATWHLMDDTFESAELSLGPFVPIFAPGWPFHRVTTRTDLSAVITPNNEWLAVLFAQGSVIGAIQVVPRESSPDAGYYITATHDRDFGRRLLELEDDEHLLDFTPDSAWFVLKGERVAPFDAYSEMYIEGDQPLSALRDHIVDWRWDGTSAVRVLLFTGLDVFGALLSWPGLVLYVAITVVAIVRIRRRRSSTSGPGR